MSADRQCRGVLHTSGIHQLIHVDVFGRMRYAPTVNWVKWEYSLLTINC